MRLLFACFLLILSNCLFAQKKDSITFSIDTINVRGMVYGYDGKAAKNLEIGVPWGRAPGYPIRVKTDTTGYFQLKGMLPNEVLHFVDEKYYNFFFPIKGSRFIVIYLPAPTILEVNATDSIVIKAQRSHPKSKFSYQVLYEKGVFYDGFEKPPVFSGGVSKFINLIRQNLKYPKKAIDSNIEGTVVIAFNIGKDGTLSDFKVIHGIGYGCDEEVIAILKKSPKWKPGLNWGRPMSIPASVAVKFSLTNN